MSDRAAFCQPGAWRNFTLCSFLLGEAETASFYAKDILNWYLGRFGLGRHCDVGDMTSKFFLSLAFEGATVQTACEL